MGLFDRLFGKGEEPKRAIQTEVWVNSLRVKKREPHGYGSIVVEDATVTILFDGCHETVLKGLRGGNYAVEGVISLESSSLAKISARMDALKSKLDLSPTDGIEGYLDAEIEFALTNIAVKRFGKLLRDGETLTTEPRRACERGTYEVG